VNKGKWRRSQGGGKAGDREKDSGPEKLRLWRVGKAKAEGSSSGGAVIGKIGRMKTEGRQSKIVTEGKLGEKRVTFRVESDKSGEDGQERKTEILAEVRKEIKKELKEIEERFNKRLEELSEKVRVENEYIESIRKRDSDWEKRWEEIKERLKEVEDELVEKLVTRLEKRRGEAEERVSEENAGRRSRSERKSGQSREVG